jgi:hypothetical protein
MNALREFLKRSKLPVLLLLYPASAWMLLTFGPGEESRSQLSEEWALPLTFACYALTAVGFIYLVAVPVWASQLRRRGPADPRAFRTGLRVATAMIAVLLPAHGVLLALALTAWDARELWFWGVFSAAGAIFGMFMLLHTDTQKEPGIYLTLRALKIDLAAHPRLQSQITELSEALGVSLPRHILAGRQPNIFATVGTVFCPAGELEGGVLCLSLPICAVLNLAEFRSLTGEAMLNLDTWLREGRKELLSATEGAQDVLRHLDESMREWSWLPKRFFHPYVVAFRLVAVAAMRLPMYIGREWLAYYLREFWASSSEDQLRQHIRTHELSAGENGAVQAISAQIKEAALSLGLRFRLANPDGTTHPLGEVLAQMVKEHPELRFDPIEESPWRDPASAWQYLRFRCELSRVSPDWCRQMAMDVAPDPSALSLFEDVPGMETRLQQLAEQPMMIAGR